MNNNKENTNRYISRQDSNPLCLWQRILWDSLAGDWLDRLAGWSLSSRWYTSSKSNQNYFYYPFREIQVEKSLTYRHDTEQSK